MSPAVAPIEQQPFTWPKDIRGALSLTFDDGRASQIEAGLPVFDQFKVNATFYSTPGALERRRDDWRTAVDAGHEVGGHTITHPCSANFSFTTKGRLPLEEMTLEQMEAELRDSNDQIESLVGVRPVSFAYPCGQKFVGRGEQLQSYVPLVARHYLGPVPKWRKPVNKGVAGAKNTGMSST